MSNESFYIRFASEDDIPVILEFITALAAYERMSDQVVATEERLRRTLFGEQQYAEVILGFEDSQPVGFALFFHNYSTFLAQPGIYLEDLFVYPEKRGSGYGKALLTYLARLAVERNCGRLEWSVLNWNKPAIGFYEKLSAKAQDEWTVYRLTGDSLARVANGGEG
ncbi:MAG: GNAT family N-acetyltransferase [Lentisphaeria bacterium]|nr:GNAT family N-acetyltransferase [Candidatus Neomarinimicrobiota bacterium]MCF7842186.1 GNAT family N-acetyltransferase [Lentisphaeria bacterium]